MKISETVVKVMFAINGLLIAGLIVSFVWAGLAIGQHEEFQDRFGICLAFQVVCILFIGIRRLVRCSHDPAG
jgi:hypothetical protein